MTQYVLIIIAYVVVAVIFSIFTAVLFYHVGRYSFVGDASKRVFAIYLVLCIATIIISIILTIINNLAS